MYQAPTRLPQSRQAKFITVRVRAAGRQLGAQSLAEREVLEVQGEIDRQLPAVGHE